MPGYETKTSQFGLVGSIRQQASDRITIVEPGSLFAPEARKGRLYIVVEATQGAARSAEACKLVARTIQKTFYEDGSFSVTSSLRAALMVANQVLYQENVKHDSRERVRVGATCAVVKGTDLFMGQVAPGQAYVWSEGRLRALPTPTAWGQAHLSAAPFNRSAGMGASLLVEPELYRSTFNPGERLLICSSNLSPLLSRDTVLELLQSPEPAEALHELCRERGLDDAHGLAVELQPPLSEAARDRPLSAQGVSERGRLAFRSMGGWFARLTSEAALTVRGGKKTRSQGDEERPDPATTMPPLSDLPANPAPKPRPLELGESLPDLYAAGLRQEQDTARRRPEVTVDGKQVQLPENGAAVDLSDTAGMSARYGPLRPRREVRPTVDLTWYQRVLLPFQQAGDVVADVARGRQAKKANPLPRTPLVRGNVNANRRQRRIAPWLQLLLLVGLVAALVLYGVNVSQQSAQQRALEFLGQADQRLSEVASAPDEAAALDRLNVARQAIDEVRASPLITNTNPTLWLRYQTLQRNYETALSSLQRLSFFEDVTVVARHPLPDGRFSSLVVPGPATSSADASAESRRFVYALDANRDNPSIYRIPIEGGDPQPYLSPGQTTPAAVVGPLRAMAWREGDLVAVDQGSSGYGYYFRSNNEWNYIRLGASDAWNPRGRLDLKTFAGNLYVWGAQDQEILRYDSGLYGNPPSFWLNPNGVGGRDLSSAVDMAVDGNIYLLQPDGHVLVFFDRQLLAEITPDAIQPPITAVTRFFTVGSPESGAFFLLDTLNERIIQVDKQSGKVVQQIKVRESDGQRLDQLTDLVIDDNNGQPQIYLVNGGTILRARMPVAPAPFRPSGNANPAATPAATPAP